MADCFLNSWRLHINLVLSWLCQVGNTVRHCCDVLEFMTYSIEDLDHVSSNHGECCW